MGERDYLREVLTAEPQSFANFLANAGNKDQQVLRSHFGDDKFRRMQKFAANAVQVKPQRNVVILPGMLGTALCDDNEPIWISPLNLFEGNFDRLSLDDSGVSQKPIKATNLIALIYGEMQLALLQSCKVVCFPYDWRLDIRKLARDFKCWIDQMLDKDAPFSVVAHSMGGLILQSYLQQFPEERNRVCRIVMLGTTTHGDYAMAILYNGLNLIMKILAVLDIEHDQHDLLQVVKTFVSTYQMLPFVGRSADAEKLLMPGAYGSLRPSPDRFDIARQFQSELTDAVWRKSSMAYIAGYGFKTVDGIKDWTNLQSWCGYKHTLLGDGTVSHALGFIDGVTNYFVNCEHSMLPADSSVIQAVQDLLDKGFTKELPTTVPAMGTLRLDTLWLERSLTAFWRKIETAFFREMMRLKHRRSADKVTAYESALHELLFMFQA